MSVILLEKDPFVAQEGTLEYLYPQQSNIRRPFYGIQIKEPRHAFLSVYQDAGGSPLIPISMKDSSAPGGWSNANHNFVLTDVAESRQEKLQIVETFGDHYTFFYGEKPIVLQCSGVLINTQDFNWKNEWWYNYNNFLRGTKAVEHRARVFLGFDDVLVQGYIMNCTAQYSKDQPYMAPFSFSILLAKPPLDLTSAADPEVPSPGSSPWVNQTEDVRSYCALGLGTRSPLPVNYDTVVEYIGNYQAEPRYSIDPRTGVSQTKEQSALSQAEWAQRTADSYDIMLRNLAAQQPPSTSQTSPPIPQLARVTGNQSLYGVILPSGKSAIVDVYDPLTQQALTF